jgi:hypothetical protein
MSDQSDTYTVVREIDVSAPPERVHSAIVDYREWRHWSPWEELDPELNRTYSGPESGVGSVYEWQGNRKAGAGRMEIITDSPHEVGSALQFIKPFKASSTTTFTLEPNDGGTHVTWTMVGQRTFMSKVMGIFTSMDKLVGKDFEKGLAQLRAYVER